MSLSIVPEVRVKDVVNGDDPMIYRALAGGTTTARLLHGSANTIGGQDAVIKLKPGSRGRDMIIKRRPPRREVRPGRERHPLARGRFPNTRMGVEATIERAFEEGQGLLAPAWQAYHKAAGRKGKAARRRAETSGSKPWRASSTASIKIHSHCYRNDEILMLLRTTAGTASGSSRSSTCSKATRSPPRSPPTAPAARPSPTGGPIRSRPTTPSRSTPPSSPRPASRSASRATTRS